MTEHRYIGQVQCILHTHVKYLDWKVTLAGDWVSGGLAGNRAFILHSGIGQIIATFSTLKFAVYKMSNPLPPEVEEMEMVTQSSSAGVAFAQVA